MQARNHENSDEFRAPPVRHLDLATRPFTITVRTITYTQLITDTHASQDKTHRDTTDHIWCFRKGRDSTDLRTCLLSASSWHVGIKGVIARTWEHSMWDHSMWDHSMWDHSMWEHSMWALYVWPLYETTLCETTLCDHSMWPLYVRPLDVTTLCVTTLCEHRTTILQNTEKYEFSGRMSTPPQKHQKHHDKTTILQNTEKYEFSGRMLTPQKHQHKNTTTPPKSTSVRITTKNRLQFLGRMLQNIEKHEN